MNQARRAFLGTASILSAWGLVQLVSGCSSADETREPAQPTKKGGGTTTTPTPTDGDEFVDDKPQATPPVDAQPGNPEWAAKAKDLESKNVGGVAYTQEAPGPFAGKERSHVPVMTIQTDGVAVIVVNHVMDAGSTGADGGMDAAADAGGTKMDAGKTDAAADAGYVDSGIRPTHYISTIWIMDDQGRVIFMKELAPTDPSPPFVAIRIPDGVKTLRAYEHCNLHGVWATSSMPV